MSYPKKAKDWRKLIINGRQFRWSFVAKAKNSLLKLQGSNSSGQQIIVTLSEWGDPWFFNDPFNVLPNEPKMVTSKLANRAFEFALQNGWNPEKAGVTINLKYKDGKFVLLNNNFKNDTF